MKRPKPDDVVELELRGVRFRAPVETVEPDPASEKFWIVRAVVAAGGPVVRKGDQVMWIEPQGSSAAVRQAVTEGAVTKFDLRWIDA